DGRSFFDLLAKTAYDLEGLAGGAGQTEKRNRLARPDKHKMAWTEGRSLTFWPRQLMTSRA
ncbi:hypothetical protein, partial [Metabacillus lacus]|uniref:hypothetical protein n=1 Tax=Metabacillus lacus TaxID=1983721 RepID=UPI001BAB0F50